MHGLDLVGVNAAVGVHMDRHLVEIVDALPLEGNQLPDVREVNMEHIAGQGHFLHIEQSDKISAIAGTGKPVTTVRIRNCGKCLEPVLKPSN